MRSIASRRAIVVGSLLVAMGAGSAGFAGQADAASSTPSLAKAKARTQVYKQVKRMASPTKHRDDPNGYVGSYAVVKPGKCEKVATSRVQCAWGMLWPNGHQQSGLMEVTAKTGKRGKLVLTTRDVGQTAQNDEGPVAAGARGGNGSLGGNSFGDDAAFLPIDQSSAFDLPPSRTAPVFAPAAAQPPVAAPAPDADGEGEGEDLDDLGIDEEEEQAEDEE
jgi:hypothetical protein